VRYFYCLFLSLITWPCFAQWVKGTVSDAQTKEPLAYVHIGVVNQNRGVISHDDGKFEIDLTGLSPEGELTFSMIGYEVKKLKIASLKEQAEDVKLTPKTYQLKEVIVKSTKIKKPIKLGRYTATKTTTGNSNTDHYGFGGEWGLRIFMDGKKYRLADVQFHLRFNTMDSVLFRINIYSVQNDLPHESLLTKEAFVKSYRNKKWIVKDMVGEGLVLNQDVIVTFELVRLWYGKGDNQLFFTHGEGYELGQTYTRASSLDQWQVDQRPPIAMFISVDEY
jgi:CarboxypepD_reg-like domain